MADSVCSCSRRRETRSMSRLGASMGGPFTKSLTRSVSTTELVCQGASTRYAQAWRESFGDTHLSGQANAAAR